MSHTVDFIKAFGLARFSACVLCKQRYRLLRKRFGFDPWHVSGAYACREYKHRIVSLASSLRPSVAVEMGCGLGEIISRVKADRRYGFDIDAQAIAAATHLFGTKASYSVASLFNTAAIRERIPASRVDVLIMVNWPHGYPMKALRSALAAINAELPISKLVIDTIRPGAMRETHIQHRLQDLKELGIVRQTVDGGDGMRDIHVLDLSMSDVPH